MKKLPQTMVARSIRALLAKCQIDRVLLAVLAGIPACDARAAFVMRSRTFQAVTTRVCEEHRDLMLRTFPGMVAEPIEPDLSVN